MSVNNSTDYQLVNAEVALTDEILSLLERFSGRRAPGPRKDMNASEGHGEDGMMRGDVRHGEARASPTAGTLIVKNTPVFTHSPPISPKVRIP